MMDRQKGKWLFECNGCGEILDTDTGNFKLAQDARRDEGWSARQKPRSDDEWEHFCPKC
jgi:hypothetical protein